MALTLAHQVYDGPEPPLLVAHGLFGSARNWHSLAGKMAAERKVVAVDLRNHGASPWDDEMTYEAMAADLAETIRTTCGGRADVLGHSMGGKAAMALALTEPELVNRLIVADIAPVRYEHSHLGYVQAMKATDLARITRRSDADPMLAEAIPEAPLRAFILQNLVMEAGQARWRVNLEALEANMPAILEFPSLDGAFGGRALFLHGGASPYVAADTHDMIHAFFPAAEIEAMPGAGHWLHAEKPGDFLAAVIRWLA